MGHNKLNADGALWEKRGCDKGTLAGESFKNKSKQFLESTCERKNCNGRNYHLHYSGWEPTKLNYLWHEST